MAANPLKQEKNFYERLVETTVDEGEEYGGRLRVVALLVAIGAAVLLLIGVVSYVGWDALESTYSRVSGHTAMRVGQGPDYMTSLMLILAWFVVVMVILLAIDGLHSTSLRRQRDEGIGLRGHYKAARECLRVYRDVMRPLTPYEFGLRAVFVEADRSNTGMNYPTLILLGLALGIGGFTLTGLVAAEGWLGLVTTRTCLGVAFLSLLMAQRARLSQSCLLGLAMPFLWFLIPMVGLGVLRLPPAVELLIFIPLLILYAILWGTWTGREAPRFLIVGQAGMMLGIPLRRNRAKAIACDADSAVKVTDEVGTYRLHLRLETGRRTTFDLRSRAELAHLAGHDLDSIKDVVPKVEASSTRFRRPLAFVLAASVLVTVTVVAGAFMMAGVGLPLPGRVLYEGSQKEIRERAAVVLQVLPVSATAQLVYASASAALGDYEAARKAFARADEVSKGLGAAGGCARALKESHFSDYCRQAAEIERRVEALPVPSGISPEVHRALEHCRAYIELVDALKPRAPSTTVHYEKALAYASEAAGAAPASFVEPKILLALLYGRVAFRARRDLRLKPDRLAEWDAHVERLMGELRILAPPASFNRMAARIYFRKERYGDAKVLLKSCKSAKDKLLLASACRFTGTSLATPLRIARGVGRLHAELKVEADLLEALILSQMGRFKEAKKNLLARADDTDAGFQARYLNLLVHSHHRHKVPPVRTLDRKLQKVLWNPAADFTHLFWPEWVTAADLDYLWGLQAGKAGAVAGSHGFRRLAELDWYPYAKRAKQYLKKWGRGR